MPLDEADALLARAIEAAVVGARGDPELALEALRTKLAADAVFRDAATRALAPRVPSPPSLVEALKRLPGVATDHARLRRAIGEVLDEREQPAIGRRIRDELAAAISVAFRGLVQEAARAWRREQQP